MPRPASSFLPDAPFRRSRILGLLGGCLLLGGCAFLGPAPQPRGDHVDADQLKQLVPGVSTQADATALLGSPTTKGMFDQNTWIYVSQMTRPVIGGTLAVLRQNVVQLSFDDRGVLRQVQSLDKANGLPVTVVARTTPSPGTEATMLQQLFGNVGRFTPGGVNVGPTAPAGGAQTQ
ncbi:MAG: outer membrane protein assembly factor BamE [Acetobacteraceae bacterium]